MALSHLLDTTPPSLLTTAARGGLRPAPDCRPRRALLHLSYSSAPFYADGAFVTHDPDQTLYENFTCGAEGNYDHYCNPELDKMVEQQSMEFDQKKRKELVWAIERKLAEDAARPILQRDKTGTCWHPYVKGYTPMV